jgi:NADH-quinone oxidoreductase subunit J
MAEFFAAYGVAILFYAFAAIAVGGAVMVVTMRNPMYGALSLLATFLSVAALFLLRNAEFLAVVQVFVYGGGIMVLFLFVIMLVNLHRLKESSLFGEYSFVGVVVVGLLAALFVAIFVGLGSGAPAADGAGLASIDGEAVGNVQAVAWRLYTDHLLPFEIASLFLLVAMIGAVVLGRKN